MSETIPVLSLRRKAENITQEHVDTLEGRLLGETGSSAAEYETVHGLFKPVNELYSAIISEAEFFRMQRTLGPNRLNDEQVKQLEARLEAAFSDAPETIDAETLPIRPLQWGQSPKVALTIAKSSAVLKERYAAQNIIEGFIDQEKPSKSWFGRARRIVPIWFARSETTEELRLLNRLGVMIKEGIEDPEDEESLPTFTKLGEAKVKNSVRYVRD